MHYLWIVVFFSWLGADPQAPQVTFFTDEVKAIKYYRGVKKNKDTYARIFKIEDTAFIEPKDAFVVKELDVVPAENYEIIESTENVKWPNR